MLRWCLLPLAGLLACAPASPDRGEVVSAGVARAVFDARSDGEPFTVSVSFPADGQGGALPGPHPGAVLVPGGRVDRDRYRWLADALAARGYVVGIPEEPHELAPLDINRTELTRALLRSDRGLLNGLVGEHLAVLGHSLGGVEAARAAVEGKFEALVLLASYPADGDPVEGLKIASLSVAGRADCSAKLADVQAGWSRLPAPTFLVVLDGVTHYQFTDSQAEDDKSCKPGVPLEQAHAAIAARVGDFLDGAIGGKPSAWQGLVAPGAGAEVSKR